MNNNILKMKKLYEIKSGERYDKYLKEHALLLEHLSIVEKEDAFPLLVKLMSLCSKLRVSLPEQYRPYYVQKKIQFKTELRNLDRRILMSQINNENYTHLEKRRELISTILGVNIN